MMRLKKGSKVEVLNAEGLYSASWFSAEIIAGNGRYYSVRYDQGPCDVGPVIVGRVPRKIIRPCPPPVQCSGSWVPGDIVEMYDSGAWKPARVSVVFGNNYFSVQLLGSLETEEVHGSKLRIRHTWMNDQWMILGKESINGIESNLKRHDSDFSKQIIKGVYGGHPRKRKLHANSSYDVKGVSAISQLPTQEYSRVIKKQRAVEKAGALWRLTEDDCLLLPEKVVATSSRKKKNNLSGKCMVASYSKLNGHSIMEFDKRNKSAGSDFSPRRTLGSYKVEFDEPSTCSSSGSNSVNMYPYSLAVGHVELDVLSGDAHSWTGSITEKQSSIPACEEDISAEIHKLELNAYRSTLEALYASGPMSWEQEALITNLRFMLHISNDEHLHELKQLSSR